MEEFTRLEREALRAVGEENPEIGPVLRRFLDTARVSRRDNTGVGFYTSFDVDRSNPPIEWPERWIGGPSFSVYLRQRGFPMAFILWFDGGYPACLEGYTDGPVFDELADVDLSGEDLSALVPWTG